MRLLRLGSLTHALVCVRPKMSQEVSFLSEGFLAMGLRTNEGSLSSLKQEKCPNS